MANEHCGRYLSQGQADVPAASLILVYRQFSGKHEFFWGRDV